MRDYVSWERWSEEGERGVMRPLAVTLGMIPGPYMEGGSEGETRHETL